jgi:hypothetical protein
VPAYQDPPNFRRIIDEIREAAVAAAHCHDIPEFLANLRQSGERFRVDTQVDLIRRPRRSANS